jgi:hypothetical protein
MSSETATRVALLSIGWVILCSAQAPANRPQPTPTPKATFTPFPGYSSDPCYKAGDHDVADLCAQWRAAIAAERAVEATATSNWISGAGAVLSFISIILVCVALGQTREANRQADATARRQLRAYLAISHTGYHGLKDDPPLPVVTLELANRGITPAYDLKSNFRAFMEKADYMPFLVTHAVLDESAAAIHGPQTEFGFYQFPLKTTQRERSGFERKRYSIFAVLAVAFTDAYGVRHRTDMILRSTSPERTGLSIIYQSEMRLGESKRRRN